MERIRCAQRERDPLRTPVHKSEDDIDAFITGIWFENVNQIVVTQYKN
jgi:hypothetical protein